MKKQVTYNKIRSEAELKDQMIFSFPHQDQSGYILLTPPHCLNLGLYTSHKALEAVGRRAAALRFLSTHFHVVLTLSPTAGQLTVSGFV